MSQHYRNRDLVHNPGLMAEGERDVQDIIGMACPSPSHSGRFIAVYSLVQKDTYGR